MTNEPQNHPEGTDPDTVKTGRMIIISGPSGVGKTTVLQHLYATCPLPLVPSISATTRPRRDSEVDGVSYYFLSDEQFQKHRKQGDFLECCEVFGRGYWYGTLRNPVEAAMTDGKWIVLEIDVEGAAKVLKYYPEALSIFIHPGSLEELERRLRGRETETTESLARRLEVASHELEASVIYQHIVYNTSVEQTASEICNILQQAEK